jgi:CheY-like chemotaxis protein
MAKILVVEDEADVRDDIVDVLELEGFDVVEAFDGLDGLEKAVATRPDLIISDVSMPRLNGHDFFKRLHDEHPEISDVPFLFLTAHADRDSELMGREMGASDYLTKPVDFEILIARLKSQLVSAQKADRKADRKISKKLQDLLENSALGGGLLGTSNAEQGFDDLLDRYQNVLDSLKHPSSTIEHLESARLKFRTPLEAKNIAVTLAQVCPVPEAAALGFTELFVNAVEHGNLALDYADKSRLLVQNSWAEAIEERLGQPAFSARRVTVRFERTDRHIQVHIQDEGAGFDFEKYLEIDPARMTDPHGRGIAFAKSISFSSLLYQGNGNQVTATIDLA